MATDKAKRSNPLAQPTRRRPDPRLKTQLFNFLQHLNRGYGIALANLDRLQHIDHRTFTSASLRNIRNRTEELRALANHELLQSLAAREGQDVTRFARSRIRQENSPLAHAVHKPPKAHAECPILPRTLWKGGISP